MRKLLRALLWLGLLIGAIAAVLRVFLVRTWVVPTDSAMTGASIAPSLAPGDVVLVLHAGHPGFSDLVRCADPQAPGRWVIGRVAGEAGDNVVMDGPSIIVNDKRSVIEMPCSPRTMTVLDPSTGAPVEIACDIETLGSGSHRRGLRPSELSHDRTERTVAEGFFWLISDNRHFPEDSRQFGAVRSETCDARIIFRLWSAKGFSDAATRFTWIN